MFFSQTSKVVPSHLETTILRSLRRSLCVSLSIGHLQWCALFLLLCHLLSDSHKNTLAAAVPTSATGCGIPEECSSEQLFEQCHSRGTIDSLLCYCRNHVPRSCRDVCDSSEAPDTCPPQCQGYLSCKADSNLAEDEGGNVGWHLPVVIVVCIAAGALVVLVVLYMRCRGSAYALPCCAQFRSADKPESSSTSSRRTVAGASVQEELALGAQETRPPDVQTLNPAMHNGSPPGHENVSLLVNS